MKKDVIRRFHRHYPKAIPPKGSRFSDLYYNGNKKSNIDAFLEEQSRSSTQSRTSKAGKSIGVEEERNCCMVCPEQFIIPTDYGDTLGFIETDASLSIHALEHHGSHATESQKVSSLVDMRSRRKGRRRVELGRSPFSDSGGGIEGIPKFRAVRGEIFTDMSRQEHQLQRQFKSQQLSSLQAGGMMPGSDEECCRLCPRIAEYRPGDPKAGKALKSGKAQKLFFFLETSEKGILDSNPGGDSCCDVCGLVPEKKRELTMEPFGGPFGIGKPESVLANAELANLAKKKGV